MRLSLTLLTLSGIVFHFLTGCQKTVDDIILNPDDTLAVFHLVKTEPNCAIVTTEGNFFAATNLTNNENIRIEVDVLKPGIWEYSTDTLNGFWFSASGVFSATGRQKITLAGVGTPILPGNYAFSVDTNSSSILISVLKNNIHEEMVDQLSYFKGTIDEVEYNFEASVQGPDDIVFGYSGIDTMVYTSFLARNFTDNPPGPATVSIQREFLYNAASSTEEDFKNLFKLGAYAFLDHRNPCIVYGSRTGVVVGWAEPNGDVWATIGGSRNQEGSSFTIVGIEDGHNAEGNYFVKVKSRFNCKLYSLQNDTVKDLTNGELVSYFIKP